MTVERKKLYVCGAGSLLVIVGATMMFGKSETARKYALPAVLTGLLAIVLGGSYKGGAPSVADAVKDAEEQKIEDKPMGMPPQAEEEEDEV